MEVDDDMLLVIVGNAGESDLINLKNVSLKEIADETTSHLDVEHLMNTVEELGEHVVLDFETVVEDERKDRESEYDEDLEQDDVEFEENNDDNEMKMSKNKTLACYYKKLKQIQNGDNEEPKINKRPEHRYKMLNPSEQKSFVQELRSKYPELKEDTELLIETLSEVMRNLQQPPLPKNYFRINSDLKHECAKCGFSSPKEPVVSRHYQEKHGKRYLYCFSCGVDFRSKGNLLTHEKRCHAVDATVVLKARALSLGPKGRSRPFMSKRSRRAGFLSYYNTEKAQHELRFVCNQCPATFVGYSSLQSHIYKHEGVRPFLCSACPAAYTSKLALIRHQKAKHSDDQFICDHCKEVFKLKTAIIAHMNTHAPYKRFMCPECGQRFAQKAPMLRHIDRAHKNLPQPCACHICPKRFSRMYQLKRHMQHQHGMHMMTRKMFFRELPSMSQVDIEQAKVVLMSDEPALNNYLDKTRVERVDALANVDEESNNMKDTVHTTNEHCNEDVRYKECDDATGIAEDEIIKELSSEDIKEIVPKLKERTKNKSLVCRVVNKMLEVELRDSDEIVNDLTNDIDNSDD